MDSLRTIRRSLADRLFEVRIERFGDDESGIEAIAEAMGIPDETWSNYEQGVVVPAEVILKLMMLTRVNSTWLMTGEGPRYSRTDPSLRFVPVN